MKKALLFAAMFMMSQPSFAGPAQPLDEASQQAVQDTKAMMADPAQIEAYARDHKEAAEANNNAKALMGNNAADTADVYKLSSDIFSTLAAETGGDPEAMQKVLAEALRNPAAFAQKFSPEQRAKLTELAGKAQAVKPSASRP